MTVNAGTRLRTLRTAIALIVWISLGAAGRVGAQQSQGDSQQRPSASQQAQNAGKGNVELLHVQGNVYMIAGAGANITVQVGDQVVFVVDSGTQQMSEEVLAAIRSLTSKHILFIINTSGEIDHTGGNSALSKAGWAAPNEAPGLNEAQGHQRAARATSSRDPRLVEKEGGNWLELPSGAGVIAHVNLLNSLRETTAGETPIPEDDWPTDTYETDSWKLYNGEGVFLYHPASAHTDGDTYVLFRGSEVVSTGDIFTLSSYPVIDSQKGGSINGLVDALNQIIDLLVGKEYEEAGTYVIPGHGRICDKNDVVNYRDMVTIIRARIQDLINQGKTLEQVQAAKPTLDYDGLYGATTGPWTTGMFVESIYRDLSKTKNQQESKVNGER